MKNARQHYVGQFNAAVARFRASDRDVYPEIRIHRRADFDGPEIYKMYVIDVLEKKDGNNLAMEINTSLVDVNYAGLQIDTPIAWNAIEFKCIADQFQEEQLIEWANKWIFDEKPAMGPQDGLTGIIHSVTRPSSVDGLVEFSVDFGSAPLEAFEELINDLSRSISSLGSYALHMNPHG